MQGAHTAATATIRTLTAGLSCDGQKAMCDTRLHDRVDPDSDREETTYPPTRPPVCVDAGIPRYCTMIRASGESAKRRLDVRHAQGNHGVGRVCEAEIDPLDRTPIAAIMATTYSHMCIVEV